MASMFSAFNPSAYKTYTPNNVKGTFGGPSNVVGGMNQGGAPQGNLMAIIDLIKKLTQDKQLQQPPMEQVIPGGQSGLQSQEAPQSNLLNRIIGKF